MSEHALPLAEVWRIRAVEAERRVEQLEEALRRIVQNQAHLSYDWLVTIASEALYGDAT